MPERPPPKEGRRTLRCAAFGAAAGRGDIAGLLAVLAPEAEFGAVSRW